MNELGIDRAHVLGGCIGGPYCLGVAQAAPDRVAAAVLQQPIGYDGENRQAFFEMFDSWANDLKPQRPDVDPNAWNAFRDRMYGGDFLFNVSRDFVRQFGGDLECESEAGQGSTFRVRLPLEPHT